MSATNFSSNGDALSFRQMRAKGNDSVKSVTGSTATLSGQRQRVTLLGRQWPLPETIQSRVARWHRRMESHGRALRRAESARSTEPHFRRFGCRNAFHSGRSLTTKSTSTSSTPGRPINGVGGGVGSRGVCTGSSSAGRCGSTPTRTGRRRRVADATRASQQEEANR